MRALFRHLLDTGCAAVKRNGACFPVGAVFDAELGLSTLAIASEDATDVDDAIARLVAAMKLGAKRGSYVATGLLVEVDIDEDGERSDGFEIRLDHASGHSRVVLVTFIHAHGAVVLGPPRFRDGERAIFLPQ